MFSSSSKIVRGELWRLKLTNGGLNLHTPTFPVCKKINEAVDADRETNRETEVRAGEQSWTGPGSRFIRTGLLLGEHACLFSLFSRPWCVYQCRFNTVEQWQRSARLWTVPLCNVIPLPNSFPVMQESVEDERWFTAAWTEMTEVVDVNTSRWRNFAWNDNEQLHFSLFYHIINYLVTNYNYFLCLAAWLESISRTSIRISTI